MLLDEMVKIVKSILKLGKYLSLDQENETNFCDLT